MRNDYILSVKGGSEISHIEGWDIGEGGVNLLLPPTSEGWGKVLFSVCLSVHTSDGVGGGGGVGVYFSQVWMVGGGGYPGQV